MLLSCAKWQLSSRQGNSKVDTMLICWLSLFRWTTRSRQWDVGRRVPSDVNTTFFITFIWCHFWAELWGTKHNFFEGHHSAKRRTKASRRHRRRRHRRRRHRSGQCHSDRATCCLPECKLQCTKDKKMLISMKRHFSITSTKRSSASENHNNPMQSQAKLSGPTSAAQSLTYSLQTWLHPTRSRSLSLNPL